MATASTKSGSEKLGKRRPVFSKRYWPVQVAVFEFENDDRLNHSIELTRTFRRDKDSDWESSTFLTTDDLLPAAKLLGEAYSVIQARVQKEIAERNGRSQDHDGTPF